MAELYKTTFTVEVLSDFPVEDLTLNQIDHEICFGECSGVTSVNHVRQLTEFEMAKELLRQESDVNFLLPEWEPCPNPHCAGGHVTIKDQKPMSQGGECYEHLIMCYICQGVGHVSPATMKEWEEKHGQNSDS